MKTYSYEELKNKKFIKLSNEYLNREFIKKHGIDSILIMSILLRNYTARGEIVFNINYLLDMLDVKRTNTNRINKIKHTLNSLAATKVLDTDIDFMSIKNDDIVRVDYKFIKDNFTTIYDFEVEEILNANTTVDKYAMFYLFVFIKYRLNVNTRVMYWSIKDMAKEMNTRSNKTVLGYIDTLEKIGLIKIANVGTRVFADNTVKQANNIYTLGYLTDTDEILQEQLNRYKAELVERDIKIEKGKKAGKQTSTKLRLNTLWEKYSDGDITDDEVKELKQKEKEYYNYIKYDEDKVANTPFVFLDEILEELEQERTKALEKELEDKGHFGVPRFNKKGVFVKDKSANDDKGSDSIDNRNNSIDINKIAIQYAIENNYNVNSIYTLIKDIENYLQSEDFKELSKVEQEEQLINTFNANKFDFVSAGETVF